jgi:GNAT superfamily N-acetyltransferase
MMLNDVDAVRADGGLVHIRLIRDSDRDGLLALNSRASDRTIYRRFFTLSRHAADTYVDQLLQPAKAQRQALVALIGDELVAVAAFERLSPSSAEVALMVDDRRQHEGIGTLLLEHLGSLARHTGIKCFLADVLAENTTMMQVLRQLGFDTSVKLDSEIVQLRLDLNLENRLPRSCSASL